MRFSYKETGGMLLGYWSRSDLVITHTTGPGPKAQHGIFHFKPDTYYFQEVLTDIFHRTGGEITFLGDWHSHNWWGSSAPSPKDISSLAFIALDERFQTPNPAIVIYKKKGSIPYVVERDEDLSVTVWQSYSNEKIELEKPHLRIIDKIPGYNFPEITEHGNKK
jgi:integrative and conjugative element protein (TIGR02256 family)